jgi:outer membrane receptor protein involved in Fe transport
MKRMLVVLVTLVPIFLFSQDFGKVSGKVVAERNGQALAGASVVIEGTALGSSADADGGFTILSVPVGTYTVRADYIGYQSVKVSNINVSANLTTTVDFVLDVSAVKGDLVEIIADTPLINENTTNTTRIVNAETIEHLPLRGVEAVVALQTGTVSDNGNIYVRGSRSSDVAYYVDGVYMNNSWDMENTSQVSNSAMEELQFQAGGFGAEYGNVNGGVVNTTTKTGGDTFSISGEYIAGIGDADASTDDGLYSYGYNLYNFNIGGPIGNGMKYFVSFEGRTIDDNDPSGAPHYMLDRDVIDWSGITKTEVELWEYDTSGVYFNTEETAAYWEGDLMINGVAVPDWQDNFFGVIGTGSDSTEVHGLSQGAQDNLANTIAGIVADDPATYGLDDYLSVDVTKVSHTDLAYNSIDNDDVIIAGYDNFRKEFGPAPNSGSDRMTVTGNLLFEYSGIRFKVGGLFNQEDGWNYVHEDRTATDYHDFSLVNNDHMPKFEQEAMSLYTNMTYALTPSSYIKLNLSTFNFTFEEGDSQHWDRVEDYGKITNDSYFTDWGNNPLAIEAFSNFRGFGAIYNDYSINESKNLSIKADYLNQLDEHEIKAGFDYRKTELKYYRVGQPLEIAKRYHDAEIDGVIPDNDWTYLTYMNAYTENIGYSITGNDSGFGYQDPGEPIIFGAYVQDKIELEDMIVNLGIRFDFFDSKNRGAKDWNNIWLDDGYVDYNPQQTYKDEVIAADGEAAFQAGLADPDSEIYAEYMLRESGKFVDVDSESYFSPRIGFSFPVTDQTKLHAQYGKYTQHPVLNRLYLADSRLAANFTQGNQTVSPNPNLKPERTTQYEVGLTQQIGAFAALDVTGFFKEIRDFTTMTNHEDGMRNGSQFVWAQYENGDFGIVKGVSLNLNMRRVNGLMANVSYTLSFAEGTGSDPLANWNITWTGDTYPTLTNPLNYDQRHTGSMMLDYRLGEDGGLLSNSGLTLLYTFGSGTAYTPSEIQSDVYGAGWYRPTSSVNSAYSEWVSNLDLKLDRDFFMGDYNFNVYLQVTNLLDSDNVDNVFESTGDAESDGWLATPEGKIWANSNPDAVQFYNAQLRDPRNWNDPRMVRFGVNFEL